MTREDAKEKCLSRDCKCVLGKDRDSNYHDIIDKVYDYFEKELEQLQNRSCDGCKYHYDKMGDCAKDYMCARGFVDYYEPKDKE
jgi:hypothetical protein